MKTKYGTVHQDKDGYYVISSSVEGNHGKKLHRLIFEEFYQIKLPSNIIIHHNDGNKTNNNIWNLIPMSIKEHFDLHNKGKNSYHYNKTRSLDYCKKISEKMNNTGYFRVHKRKSSNYKQGFTYVYSYQVKHKLTRITSVSLKKLEKKVKAKGLTWCKLSNYDIIYDEAGDLI